MFPSPSTGASERTPGGISSRQPLRNRLVHVYQKVDDQIVHASLGDGLEDLGSFSQATARLVEHG